MVLYVVVAGGLGGGVGVWDVLYVVVSVGVDGRVSVIVRKNRVVMFCEMV